MSHASTARLFVAVDPPGAVREELAAWARGVAAGPARRRSHGRPAQLRVLDPESLHVTLCFLGARPVHELEPIASALEGCGRDVGELAIGAPLWLPSRHPRTLAVEIRDGAGELAGLHDAVARAMSAASGWEPERRRFKAHLTVARMRGSGQRRVPQAVELLLPATPQLSFTPEAVILYRSWLSPTGVTYEPLATCGLLAGDR